MIGCIPPLPSSTAGLRAVQYFCLFCVSRCPLYKEERVYEKVLDTQFTGGAVQFLRIRGLKFDTKRKRSHLKHPPHKVEKLIKRFGKDITVHFVVGGE